MSWIVFKATVKKPSYQPHEIIAEKQRSRKAEKINA